MAKFLKVCRNAGVTSYHDFLRLAAFAAVGPSATCELHGHGPRASFEKWCFFVRFPDEAEGGAAAAPVEEAPQAAAAPAAAPERERVKGRRAVLTELGAAPPPPGSDPGVQSPRQAVAAQARAFVLCEDKPGAASARHLCAWWHSRGKNAYPDLLPGVRVLLCDPAGNPPLERVFGHARALLTPGRKLSDLKEVLLQTNGPALRLPGYAHFAAPEGDD